jgi:methylmalonyl-CoA mutase N-terminal domain/subunit
LNALELAARDAGENLMPYLLDAARAEATEGEMVQTLQGVFGSYTESPVF